MGAALPRDPDLIIFDCDGVLVDSETLSAQVTQRVMADLGCELSLSETLEHFAGSSTEVFHARAADLLGRTLEADWDREYATWYEDALRTGLQPVPGIHQALSELSHPRCVASNSSHQRIRASLDATDLLAHFGDRIYSAQDVERGKPEPDLFLLAASRTGVEPERCVVVEDSVFGVRAARAAGMRVLAFAGVTAAGRLAGERTVVFDSMADLPRLIGTV
ncbi:MAG: HAD family hydrolase [Pseudolysinimonas sp.]|uniref:HAD family hydrolase n=1 Tax=Pseudolysinimonas sp. TaxID=2680009 RepID=UPI003C78A636